MISGKRVKQGRELKGFTQKEFGEKIGLQQSQVAQLENGLLNPKKETLNKIVFISGLTLDFFKSSPRYDFPLGSLLFRSRVLSLKQKNQIKQMGRLVFEIHQKLEKLINPLPNLLPQIKKDPLTAAKLTREKLGLKHDLPIKGLIFSLERAGVIVLGVPNSLDKVDAFSVLVDQGIKRPVIIISKMDSGDRINFSVAHELAHLVMHWPNLKGNIKSLEREANLFAGEFLFPEISARKELIPPITLNSLAPLKTKWGLSLQALIRRAYDLAIITERQYKYLNQQISQIGWKKKEPNLGVSIEKPRALAQMAELLFGNPIDFKNFTAETKIPSSFLKKIIECHVLKTPNNEPIIDNARQGVLFHFTRNSS